MLLENTLLVAVLAERQLAAVGEVFDLLLRLDGIPVETPPMVDGAWSLDLENVGRGNSLLELFMVLCEGVLGTLLPGLAILLLGVQRARSAFSF